MSSRYTFRNRAKVAAPERMIKKRVVPRDKKTGFVSLRYPSIAMLKISKRNSAESALLNLPGEIRNRICRFVLSRPSTLLKTKGGSADLRLLRTCRQIYDETAVLPYALTTFKFSGKTRFAVWYTRRMTGQLTAICDIEFEKYRIGPATANSNEWVRQQEPTPFERDGALREQVDFECVLKLLDYMAKYAEELVLELRAETGTA